MFTFFHPTPPLVWCDAAASKQLTATVHSALNLTSLFGVLAYTPDCEWKKAVFTCNYSHSCFTTLLHLHLELRSPICLGRSTG